MSKLKPVVDVKLGLYLWQMSNGQFVGDEDGNFMCIPSEYGDIRRINAITEAAKHYGVYEGGRPVFKPGGRMVSDSEYEDQMARASDGLLPDPYDFGALSDELRAKNG